ncbi:MAG TPA: hypothetical protein VHT03_06720 [Rhizomicrobium sp.]|nr:hypothetical protein [Rhizomicrobium sp.]
MRAHFAAKILIAGVVSTSVSQLAISQSNSLPTSAIILDSAGRNGSLAQEAVFRVFCSDMGAGGTEFLNQSRDVIIAAHVVSDCSRPTGVVLAGSSAGAKVI